MEIERGVHEIEWESAWPPVSWWELTAPAEISDFLEVLNGGQAQLAAEGDGGITGDMVPLKVPRGTDLIGVIPSKPRGDRGDAGPSKPCGGRGDAPSKHGAGELDDVISKRGTCGIGAAPSMVREAELLGETALSKVRGADDIEEIIPSELRKTCTCGAAPSKPLPASQAAVLEHLETMNGDAFLGLSSRCAFPAKGLSLPEAATPTSEAERAPPQLRVKRCGEVGGAAVRDIGDGDPRGCGLGDALGISGDVALGCGDGDPLGCCVCGRDLHCCGVGDGDRGGDAGAGRDPGKEAPDEALGVSVSAAICLEAEGHGKPLREPLPKTSPLCTAFTASSYSGMSRRDKLNAAAGRTSRAFALAGDAAAFSGELICNKQLSRANSPSGKGGVGRRSSASGDAARDAWDTAREGARGAALRGHAKGDGVLVGSPLEPCGFPAARPRGVCDPWEVGPEPGLFGMKSSVPASPPSKGSQTALTSSRLVSSMIFAEAARWPAQKRAASATASQ